MSHIISMVKHQGQHTYPARNNFTWKPVYSPIQWNSIVCGNQLNLLGRTGVGRAGLSAAASKFHSWTKSDGPRGPVFLLAQVWVDYPSVLQMLTPGEGTSVPLPREDLWDFPSHHRIQHKLFWHCKLGCVCVGLGCDLFKLVVSCFSAERLPEWLT